MHACTHAHTLKVCVFSQLKIQPCPYLPRTQGMLQSVAVIPESAVLLIKGDAASTTTTGHGQLTDQAVQLPGADKERKPTCCISRAPISLLLPEMPT